MEEAKRRAKYDRWMKKYKASLYDAGSHKDDSKYFQEIAEKKAERVSWPL